MALAKSEFSKRDSLKRIAKDVASRVRSGWWAGTEDSGVGIHITHEFGHVVESYMKTDPPKRRALSEWMARWWKDATVQSPSKYGRVDTSEFFAECFAAIYHTPKSRWTEAIADLYQLLEREY